MVSNFKQAYKHNCKTENKNSRTEAAIKKITKLS